MSEKPLLLSSAKTGVLVDQKPGRVVYFFAALGLLVVLVGAADVSSRLAHAAFGANASLSAFAPAAIMDVQSLTPVATSTPLTPTRLQIPSIGVNAKIEQVGEKADGSMGTPTTFGDTAWFALGPKPGQPGNAVIDGHVNNALTTAGVFEHLDQVKAGDTIVVSSASSSLTYVVTQTELLAYNATSTDAIFTNSGPSQLVLITCEGDWLPSAKSFNQRLVVFASLSSNGQALAH